MLKYNKLKKTLFIVIIIFAFWGCKNLITTSSINEGEIDYTISVIKNNNAILTNDMLPSTMTMSFKDNMTCFSLSAFGVFATDLIADNKNKTLIQTLKLMGKKFAVYANKDSLTDFMKYEPTLSIDPTSKTKTIAGYKCKHAKCTFHNPDFPSFDVYYTEEIKIEEPNFYSQYAPIKGVLMEFTIYRYNVLMKLSAKQVNKVDVNDVVFEAKQDYKAVSKKEMDSYFNPQ